MKIVHIETEKVVKKSKKEIEKEDPISFFVNEYKKVPLKESIYIVEMSAKELQLVNFYLELENRKPIFNVEIDAEIKKEKENDSKN